MRAIWLNPVAWVGVATITVPIVIHLLTRQQTRRLPFPTLRFLRPTRLAALRRRVLRDWLLLTVRVLILATAAAALAGPVFVSGSREQDWRSRVVRALVVAPSATTPNEPREAAVAAEQGGSFASAVFRPRERVADGIRDAARWLDTQPPGSREIVVMGDLKAGMLTSADLSMVPAGAGLRFLPFPESAARRNLELHVQQGDERMRVETTLLDQATRVSYAREGRGAPPMTIRAASNEQTFAEAALNAVLRRGLVLSADEHRVLVVFDGADTSDLQNVAPVTRAWMRRALASLNGMSGGQREDTLVVRVHARARGSDTARVIERVAHAAFDEDRSAWEPVSIGAQTLAAWSRQPAADEPTASTVQPRDEGDRRWLWGAVLLLLGLESVIRRRGARAHPPAADVQEARVA